MSELKNILYVEDEDDIRAVAMVGLESVGKLSVMECSSGSEAMEKAGDFKADMVLLDVMMPGMDGPSVLKELKKMDGYKNIPFVFITAKAQDEERSRLLELGAEEVITKPFDPISLAQQLKEIHQEFQSGK